MTADEERLLLELGYTVCGMDEIKSVMREKNVSALEAHNLISAAPKYDPIKDKHLPGLGKWPP